MPAERIQRLLRLIAVLQRDEPNTTESLMKDLDVSRRTLFRDLHALEEAGFPYSHERSFGYRLDKRFHLPPINLTVPETLGLMMFAKAAIAQRERPMVGSALSAIYKLISTVPIPIRDVCQDLMSNVSVAPDAQPIGDKEMRYHMLLQRAIDEGRSCRVVYRSPVEQDDTHAVLNPYLLHFVNRAWYVLGYTDVHDDVRMFKLTRISELEITDEAFERPKNFKAEDKLGSAWRMIPEGKEYEVVLEFSKKVATNVSEVRWHVSQEHELLKDGRCRMRFKVDGLSEIAWWVCGYADQVLVLKPPELRDKVEQMHRNAMRRYQDRGSPEVVTKSQVPKSRVKNRETSN